jgi:hypothetical protein
VNGRWSSSSGGSKLRATVPNYSRLNSGEPFVVIKTMNRSIILLGIAILVRMVCSASGAGVTVKLADREPPKEAAEAIRKVLQPKAIQVLDGDKMICELWFVKELPLKSKVESLTKSLDALDQVTLMGVASFPEAGRDYKDNEFGAGTYTIRFGLQPQDGDHLGTSEYPFFAVLVPAKGDTDVAGLKTYKAMVRASGKATAAGHPAILSLRPPSSEDGPTPAVTTPAAAHKALRIKVPAKAPDSDQPTSVLFELVVAGKYKS